MSCEILATQGATTGSSKVLAEWARLFGEQQKQGSLPAPVPALVLARPFLPARVLAPSPALFGVHC